MKRIVFILLLITLIFTFMANSGSKESIVVCSSLEQFRNDEMQKQLSEKFPQYNIIVMYTPTGKAAAKVYAEGTGTEVDMVVGLETGYLNKLKESLADISGLSTIPYVEGLTPADNHNLWTIWDRQAGAIIVNTEILDKHGLNAPTTYADLLKPEYQGLIAMPDPKSSGTGYFFYKNWINVWGDESTLDYVDRLKNNLKQFTESGSGPIKMLTQGEVAIGLALTFQAVNKINEGQPFEIIFPPEGSPYSLTGCAIINGHQDKAGVKEVYQYIVNEFLVYDKEYFSPETIYDGQTNTIENYPTDIAYADMTGIQDDKEKERLLTLWKY